ncbi:hypothetical protein [Actinomadura sp. DC4]|uniref:hypothetical protein n=1 Tax=Actinomadura sp. DC4 TaxID=3055069 RepID=UPI0025B0B160|nr:hypothetical protein [Actinomadura sp. DC4]MDN3359718.1 hypothetical protein [Actinomadura sp. DC4]
MTDKPNLPGYNVSDITQVETGGGEHKYESYWAYLKSQNAPVDDPNMHNAEQITAWAKAANPGNVSKHGQAFLDFHDALTKLNFSAKSNLDLPGLLFEIGKELHEGWHGGATAAPEAQRQLTLLYQSAKDLMDTSTQAGYTLKGHGDNALPAFKKNFESGDNGLDSQTAVYMDTTWKQENYDKYPALQGAGHTKQDELDLGRASMQAQTAFRDDWARKKLVAHNTDVATSYDSLPYMLNLSFPPGTNVPPPPPVDTGHHGDPSNNGNGNGNGGHNKVPGYNGSSGSGSIPHVPSASNLAASGNPGSGTNLSGIGNPGSGTNLSGVGNPGSGTDLSGVGNSGLGNGGLGNGGTSLNPGGLGGGTSLGSGGTPLPGTGTGTGLGTSPVGLGSGSGFPSSYSPVGLGGGGGGGGGLGGGDPLGLKSPGAGSVQEAGGTIGSAGTVNGAAAAAEEAAAAGAANAARGSGMMPMMPPMMGGQGQNGDGRERATWLTEDENIWAADDDVAPPLIG